MNTPSNAAALSDRRRRLGASRETMAAGLGLPVDALKAIEDGMAPDQHYGAYETWLSRIEAWPPDMRARQFRAAGKGARFDAGDKE